MRSSRSLALTEGVLTTVIWASSFVFIKMGLAYLKPITLAGMRYFTAFLLLLPIMAYRGDLKRPLARDQWIILFVMGLCAYTIGNGALFWGLRYLPAVTGSFLFSLLPLPVVLLGIVWLKEKPNPWQVAGFLVALAGSGVFFYRGLSAREPLAVGVVSMGVLAFSFYGVFSRRLARQGDVSITQMTAIPLGFGGGILLLIGLLGEGAFTLSLPGIAVVLWLAVVNTVVAYLLFYRSLRVLAAFELHVILNLSPIGTFGLAALMLGERLTTIQIGGMITVMAGVSLVQWRR
ncbi:MAG: DMT family transporter [Deltaproteobacteria bacterium]|nr:DMT family transporter [Deltaproteobacteria bacterium]